MKKEAEQILRESQERYRAMADALPVLVWQSTTDKLCNYFNKVWLEFTGRTTERELGNGWADVVHPGDLRRCSTLPLLTGVNPLSWNTVYVIPQASTPRYSTTARDNSAPTGPFLAMGAA